MQNLFSSSQKQAKQKPLQPLAERMRPQKLADFIGQDKLIGKHKPLEALIRADTLQSLIFWGPPGVGKTTLARLIARQTQARFIQFSAVTSGVKEMRQIIETAQVSLKNQHKKTILFVDEIHHFNKTQQDAFLPWVENGTIILIGATTENPSFALTPPLLSRARIFIFEPLTEKQILTLVKRAVKLFPKHTFEQKALEFLARAAEGDARAALNSLELATRLSKKINLQIIQQSLQRKAIYWDKRGDRHYETISAFIKSMRGSDPDAALYWLARLLEGGEDVRFIARRMTIFASEDIGNADPHALTLANACFQAVNLIGLPEAKIILAQTATYLSAAPKSNAAYLAINQALKTVKNQPLRAVPKHLRNAPTKLAKKLDYGKDYLYPHNYNNGQVKQTYLPPELESKKFYQPKEIGYEKKIKARLEKWQKMKNNSSSHKITDQSCPKGLG